jgi:hypothetical protein
LGQIEDGGAETASGRAEKGSAAGLLDVVAMSGDGQDVGSEIWFHTRSFWLLALSHQLFEELPTS